LCGAPPPPPPPHWSCITLFPHLPCLLVSERGGGRQPVQWPGGVCVGALAHLAGTRPAGPGTMHRELGTPGGSRWATPARVPCACSQRQLVLGGGVVVLWAQATVPPLGLGRHGDGGRAKRQWPAPRGHTTFGAPRWLTHRLQVAALHHRRSQRPSPAWKLVHPWCRPNRCGLIIGPCATHHDATTPHYWHTHRRRRVHGHAVLPVQVVLRAHKQETEKRASWGTWGRYPTRATLSRATGRFLNAHISPDGPIADPTHLRRGFAPHTPASRW